MDKLKGIGNYSLTAKICLAGLFIALAMITQKIVAINYLASLPFFRISFGGPAIIVFSSIVLGPFWGAAVGFFSDLLGYFVFDASAFAYMPQISLTYLLLGFVSFFVYKLIDKVKNDKLLFVIETIFLVCLFAGVSSYLIFFYECALLEKILIPIGLFLLIGGLLVIQILGNSKKTIFYAPIKISFTYFLVDLFVLTLFGSLMKTWAFSVSTDTFWSLFKTVIITQSLVMIFNVAFNTSLLSTFIRIVRK